MSRSKCSTPTCAKKWQNKLSSWQIYIGCSLEPQISLLEHALSSLSSYKIIEMKNDHLRGAYNSH